MEKRFVCDVPQNDTEELLGIFEMKSTLESLIKQIADDNDILKAVSYTHLTLSTTSRV